MRRITVGQIHSYVWILQRLVGKQYLFSICCKADRKTAAVDLKLPNLLQLTTVIKDQPEIQMRFLSVSLTQPVVIDTLSIRDSTHQASHRFRGYGQAIHKHLQNKILVSQYIVKTIVSAIIRLCHGYAQLRQASLGYSKVVIVYRTIFGKTLIFGMSRTHLHHFKIAC